MKRYSGESLGTSPRVVVLGSCKVGNFVVTTPLLRGLKERWPNGIVDFIGSEITVDFEKSCPWIDWRCSWDNNEKDAGFKLLSELSNRSNSAGNVDLAINLDGFNPVTQVLSSWLQPNFVAGTALTEDLRRNMPCGDLPQHRFLEEKDWDSIMFLERHKSWLKSNSISELFCQLAFIDTDSSKIMLESINPDIDVPEILIH